MVLFRVTYYKQLSSLKNTAYKKVAKLTINCSEIIYFDLHTSTSNMTLLFKFYFKKTNATESGLK